ncbi:hypothetical protein HGRIS_008468 [Hohenbuehelia grisea]|uniref:Uncharacterized protein n=1 Tax=Hohenbuehelia grisea TaxID=104357 RepID=A0ABR3J8E1_9AGAR
MLGFSHSQARIFTNTTMAEGDPIVTLNNYLQGQGRLTALSWAHTNHGPSHSPQWTADCKSTLLCSFRDFGN